MCTKKNKYKKVILVLVQYLLHQVIHSFDWLNPLHVLQKGIFRLIPYVSLFHGQLSFFNIAVQNARCRRLPNRLHEVVCFARQDPCCGKIIIIFTYNVYIIAIFTSNVILVAINI